MSRIGAWSPAGALRVASPVFAAVLMLLPSPTAAHEALDAAIERIGDPGDDPDAYRSRAVMRRELGDYQGAAHDLEHAERLDSDPGIWLDWAELRMDEADYAAALVALERYIEGGGDLRAYSLRARALAEQAEWVGAERACRAALEFAQDVDVHRLLARSLAAQERYAEAAQSAAAGFDATCAVVLAIDTFEWAGAAGDWSLALATVDAAEGGARVGTRWSLRRARALTALGRSAEAAESLERARDTAERAVERRPSCSNLLDRARVYVALGEPQRAQPDLDAVAARCAGDAGIRAAAAELQGAPR